MPAFSSGVTAIYSAGGAASPHPYHEVDVRPPHNPDVARLSQHVRSLGVWEQRWCVVPDRAARIEPEVLAVGWVDAMQSGNVRQTGECGNE